MTWSFERGSAHAPPEPAYSAAGSSPGLQRALRLGEKERGAALPCARARWRAPQLRVPHASPQRRWVRPRRGGSVWDPWGGRVAVVSWRGVVSIA